MEKRHMQFFPLAFVAIGWFLHETANSGFSASDSRRRLAIGVTLTGIALGGAALFFRSIWLAHFTLIILLFGWAIVRFEQLTLQRLLGICGLGIITVPPPLSWDEKLVHQLQYLSSLACSKLMDVAGFVHVLRGNTIEISDRQLFVEEACSGVDSQYALMAVAGILLLIGRAPFPVSILTILTVPIWAILGNLLRIFLIVVGLEVLGIDLASGTPHMLLGFVAFGLAAYAHWSSVQFLNYLYCVYTDRRRSTAVSITNAKKQSTNTKPASDSPSLSLTWLALPALLIPFSYQAWRVVLDAKLRQIPSISADEADRFPGEFDLPGSLMLQNRVSFKTVSRVSGHLEGQHSRVWQYYGPLGEQIFSLDLPFRGFHGLWICYQSTGWRVSEPIVIEDRSNPSQENFPYYEMLLENDFGEMAVLHFSLFNEDGTPCNRKEYFNPTALSIYEAVKQRLLIGSNQAIEPFSYQFQMLTFINDIQTDQPLTNLRNMYVEFRKRICSSTVLMLGKQRE
jgi:exosortase